MSKIKIPSETIKEIITNQQDGRQANAAAAMARVAGAAHKAKAPVALLEQPEPTKELPASTPAEPSVEDFAIPVTASPSSMPARRPDYAPKSSRTPKGPYTTESAGYRVSPGKKEPRDITALPAEELTLAEREAEIARLAEEQARDEDANDQPDDTDVDDYDTYGGHNPSKKLAAELLGAERAQRGNAARQRTVERTYDGVVPFDRTDNTEAEEPPTSPFGYGMHVESPLVKK